MRCTKEQLITVHSVLNYNADPVHIIGADGFRAVDNLCTSCLKIGSSKTYNTLSTAAKKAYALILDELMNFLSDKDIAYCLSAIRICVRQDVFIYPISTKCTDMMNKVHAVIRYVRLHNDDIESIPDVETIKIEELYRIC